MQLESRMSRVALMERASQTAHSFPLGSKLGVFVMALGLAADLVAHLSPGLAHAPGATSGAELSAHLVVFVGMALVLLGVVVDGARSGPRSSGRSMQGRRSNAVR
jgi:hypothetical protein